MCQRNFLLVSIRRTYFDTHSQAGSKIFHNERPTKCVSLLHDLNKQKILISTENLSHAAISIFLQRPALLSLGEQMFISCSWAAEFGYQQQLIWYCHFT